MWVFKDVSSAKYFVSAWTTKSIRIAENGVKVRIEKHVISTIDDIVGDDVGDGESDKCKDEEVFHGTNFNEEKNNIFCI